MKMMSQPGLHHSNASPHYLQLAPGGRSGHLKIVHSGFCQNCLYLQIRINKAIEEDEKRGKNLFAVPLLT